MHSNQEWEAWIALYVLEACVKNCGERFHDLIGRFRFLNEIIKIVSPKYYANRTSEKVKTKCIELIYSWSEGLPQKTKIKEAYDMLKRQGIVTADPVNVDKLEIAVAPRVKNPIFEDEEKSKQLTRLLKSRNPQDLELANRIIKNMVKQDEIKIEKTSHRINELEQINNNMKLLNEMLLNHNQATALESERETIKYLYEELNKMRPNLVKLATECDENDESIGDILKANDQCERILNQYKSMFDKNSSSFIKFTDDVKLVELNQADINNTKGEDLIGNFSSASDLLTENAQKTSSTSYDPLKELQDLFLSNNTDNNETFSTNNYKNNNQNLANTLIPQSSSQNSLGASLSLENNNKNFDDSKTFYALNNISKINSQPPQTPQIKAINELNQLGRSLMEKSLNDPKTPLNAATTSTLLQMNTSDQKNLSLNEIQQKKISLTNNNNNNTNNNTFKYSEATTAGNNGNLSEASFNALNALLVKLEDIKPGSVGPLNLYEKNSLKIILHFARDSPSPNIHVVVISVTSMNTESVLKNFSFQAAVPKTMRVKLQPASRTDLPCYNPILPPTAITQVMLIANPNKEQIRLKYKINYSFDDLSFNETDELKSLPI
jgi:ADP-ribosylation factor-binding protein GGA